MNVRHALVTLLLAAPVLAGPAAASGATLRGLLLDEQGRPVPKAQVRLIHRISGFRQNETSDGHGRFTFSNIPYNDYHLEVFNAGFEDIHRAVELRASLPVELRLTLKAVGATVEIHETLSLVETHPTVHLDVDKSLIRLTPAPVQSRALESILLATPGFVANDNGRFHFRGSHGQMTFVVDGVPISDHTHASFSNSLDPAQVESLEVMTAGIPAEFGGKPVAVVSMTTRSGLGADHPEGDVSMGMAHNGTREGAFTYRTGTEGFGVFVTGATSQTDRFLDPPTFSNLHNSGTTGRVYSRFDWVLSEQDTLRFSIMGGRTNRDVPNLPSQQAAGMDWRIRTTDANLSLAWNHLFSDRQSLEASVFHRQATARLRPTRERTEGEAAGGPDFPVWAHQDRTLNNWGLNLAFSQRFGQESLFKTGLQLVRFPLHERFAFTLTQDGIVASDSGLYPYTPAGGGSIFRFEDRLAPTLASAYAQTDLHLGRFFVSAGLRLDRWTQGSVQEQELQPRLGLSYSFGDHGPTLRGSLDRLFITPDRENLALSSASTVAALGADPDHGESGTAGALKPEIVTSQSLSLEHQLGRWGRVMVEVWRKFGRRMSDVEQFLNTGVEFPLQFAHGFARGANVRLDLLSGQGWSGYLSLGRTRAQVEGPTTGGLQLHLGAHPEPEATGRIPVDHDQKLAAQLGMKFEREGSWAMLQGRYDSGLVAGHPEDAQGNPDFAFGLDYVRFDATDQVWRVAPRTLWDLSAGHRIPLGGHRHLELSTSVMNLFDRKTLYNFLSHRGGTHVHPGRTVAFRIKFGF